MIYSHEHMPGGVLKSIFFGGGTPSLMPPKVVEALINKASSLWPSKNMEITLEANPNSMEALKLADFKKAGINRLSMGIQSLRADALTFLGRRHSLNEAIQALHMAAKLFDRFSFDLIYARPQQTLKEWSMELTEALKYARGHMSLYQLTIEEGTAFHRAHQRGDFVLPSERKAAAFYEITQDIMSSHHLPAYEISNHAIKGQESQHSLIYWRYGSFAAIGPGAHGRLQNQAFKRLKAPETWMKAVFEKGHGTDTIDHLTVQQQFDECFMMGLRLNEGVSKETLSAIDHDRLQRLLQSDVFKSLEKKFIVHTPQAITTTIQGRLCLNTLINMCLRE